jgi:hypothetical protein
MLIICGTKKHADVKKTFNSSDVQTPKKREVDPSNLGELPRMLGQPGYTRHI